MWRGYFCAEFEETASVWADPEAHEHDDCLRYDFLRKAE